MHIHKLLQLIRTHKKGKNSQNKIKIYFPGNRLFTMKRAENRKNNWTGPREFLYWLRRAFYRRNKKRNPSLPAKSRPVKSRAVCTCWNKPPAYFDGPYKPRKWPPTA
jgi:hypothetical protein